MPALGKTYPWHLRSLTTSTHGRQGIKLYLDLVKLHGTQQFLSSVSIVQALKMMMGFRPFLDNPSTALLALSLQPSKDVSPSWDERFCRPTFCSTPNKKSRAKTQSTKRRFIVPVAVSLSQWRQREGWSRPRLGSLSAVQHLLCATRHKKKQHLCGAQVFQIPPLAPSKKTILLIPERTSISWLCRVLSTWVTKYDNRIVNTWL